MTDFGTWLNNYMNTQQPPIGRPELARRTGIDVRTIGRWVNNEIRPTPDKLRLLVPVLGVSHGDLLTLAGYGAPTEPEPTLTAARPLDDLAVELDAMLDPHSPLGDADRTWLRAMVNQAMEAKRGQMRRRKRRTA